MTCLDNINNVIFVECIDLKLNALLTICNTCCVLCVSYTGVTEQGRFALGDIMRFQEFI